MELPIRSLATSRIVGPRPCYKHDRGFFLTLLLYGILLQAQGYCVKIFKPYNNVMTTKGRGRPPKEPEDKHVERLEIRLTAEDRELIEKAASGKVSSWARDVLVRAAKRRK